MGRLNGKVAIVTGAARGSGEAIARTMVAEGAVVVLGDVRDDLGQRSPLSWVIMLCIATWM